MTAPLTPIVEGKPLVFDVPVPVGEVIPAGTAYLASKHGGNWYVTTEAYEFTVPGVVEWSYFTARPPVAPESFADGDVAWVRVERTEGGDWTDPDLDKFFDDHEIAGWIYSGTTFKVPSPRPESVAAVLDDANLPDELRARIEKAVGKG